MAATDTSIFPASPASAERPGVDEREHPVGPQDRSPDVGFDYLREMQRMILEARKHGDATSGSSDPSKAGERGGHI